MSRISSVVTALLLAFGTFAWLPLVSHADENEASIPQIAEKDAIEWANRLIDVIQKDEDAAPLFSWSAMTARTLKGLDVSDQTKAAAQNGVRLFVVSPNGFLGQIRNQYIEGHRYKYMRVFQDKDGTRVQLRLLLPDGDAKFDDYLLAQEAGRVVAVDIKTTASGDDASLVIRWALLPLLARDNEGLRESLTENELLSLDHSAELKVMAQAILDDKFDQVASLAAKLPAGIRNGKECVTIELTAAQLLSDAEAQREIIDRFRRLEPDNPAINLHSIEYFTLTGDFEQALASAERFRDSNGEEAYIVMKIAYLQAAAERLDEALKSAEKAIELEPDCVDTYWMLITVAGFRKDHATINKTLQKLVTDFGIELTPQEIEEDEFYEEFIKSPEFEELEKFLESQKK
ncbi:MAG: hypothetical protein U0929_02745 [Planctomycetaceae bacterium]